ncbi:uncharacterized protein EKO05_0005055 [Ascochyta rabiei]|nr:uncharacterized protein EKO05_0005055 [Ascochyta rabiei]UPX14577.1 hypothetical protein EKO05_0005055 [Ascochyta rabiei]
MRRLWEEATSKNLNRSENYSHVAVLLVKWAEELDELKTRSELEELAAVFREQFHFHTETVELNVASKPQLQLHRRISTFAAENDGPNSLMIVYYTGNGVYRELENYLQLFASIVPVMGGGLKDAHVNWQKAEKILRSEDIDADVLTILDTCYASNSMHNRSSGGNGYSEGKSTNSSRRMELLSACPIDQTTASPGPWSFTRALIDTLRDLVRERGDKSFSTFYLNQRICMDVRRHETPSHLWRLLPNDQSISLAPIGTSECLRASSPPLAQLKLSFGLRDQSLNEKQVEFLAHCLTKALQNQTVVSVRKIDWLRLEPTPLFQFERWTVIIIALLRWKKAVLTKRGERQ